MQNRQPYAVGEGFPLPFLMLRQNKSGGSKPPPYGDTVNTSVGGDSRIARNKVITQKNGRRDASPTVKPSTTRRRGGVSPPVSYDTRKQKRREGQAPPLRGNCLIFGKDYIFIHQATYPCGVFGLRIRTARKTALRPR